MEALTEYSWPGNVRELENVIERLASPAASQSIQLDDLPLEIRSRHTASRLRPKRERRRTVADDLYQAADRGARVVLDGRCIRCTCSGRSRAANVRDLVRKGLEEARGNYKIVARLFNMEQHDYKRFLNFLRKHDCQVPFKEYR